MSERLLRSCDGFCGASEQEAWVQISRWQFGANSSIILEFIALRVKASGDGPFVLYLAFNSSLVDSTYDCKTQQNTTLTGQQEEGDVQLKVS